MKTIKDLKHARFTWDEKAKSLIVEQPLGNRIELDKTYAFALMRFVIRIAQKNFLKNPLTNKEASDTLEEGLELEEDDSRQTKFNF